MPVGMAEKANVSLSMLIRTCKNWRNSCKESPWPNRKSGKTVAFRDCSLCRDFRLPEKSAIALFR